jgi:hypothetical protein
MKARISSVWNWVKDSVKKAWASIKAFFSKLKRSVNSYLNKCKPGNLILATFVFCVMADIAWDLAVAISMPWLIPVAIVKMMAILGVFCYGVYQEWKADGDSGEFAAEARKAGQTSMVWTDIESDADATKRERANSPMTENFSG